MPDPRKKLYDSIPMRNKQIDTLMTKFKIGPGGMPYSPAYKEQKNSKVKDVEIYNPKTGKSRMTYKASKNN